jgi:uncharacterized metal-binding protein
VATAVSFCFGLDARKKIFRKMINGINLKKPLVYSCSGCSSAAQMANYLAVRLDRLGIAEMSCIAGVGGNVKKLVRTALSGRRIIVIDGCPLACSRACLASHLIAPDEFFELGSFGVRKKAQEDFDQSEADKFLNVILEKVNQPEIAANQIEVNDDE